MAKVSVVLAVMNEEKNIVPINQELKKVLKSNELDVEIIYVCDPSTDSTLSLLRKLSITDTSIRVIALATRAGQTECLRAGMEAASGEIVITMDADFQDPPSLINEMITKWKEGNDVVHGRRIERGGDFFLYRLVTSVGYKFLRRMTNGRVRHNVGDFRLMNRKALNIVLQIKDPNPFWRGICSLEGLKEGFVEYSRPKRNEGSSKYSKHFGSPTIAARGLVSFSQKPLVYVQVLGGISAISMAIFSIVILILFVNNPVFPRGIPTLTFILVHSGICFIFL
ncbi:glycosyltransferase [bacterium]|nr:glycosyltransferase [Candidatus Elulimicrobium humile]